MSPAPAAALPARWVGLLQTPEIKGSSALLTSLRALIEKSEMRGVDKAGFPRWVVYDARSDREVTWGITGLRGNGLTGWFESAPREDPVGSSPGSWRIGFDGRLHRGLPWMRALAAEALAAPPEPEVPQGEKIALALIEAIETDPGSPPALLAAAARARTGLGR